MHRDGEGFVEDDARASQLIVGLNGVARVSDGEPGQVMQCHVVSSFLSHLARLGLMLLLALMPVVLRAPCAAPSPRRRPAAVPAVLRLAGPGAAGAPCHYGPPVAEGSP